MNILIFNWRDITHPKAGGAEVFIHEIAARLALKNKITMFCGAYPGCETTANINNVRIIRKGKKYSIYLLAPFFYLWKLRDKIDIIIDCENGIPFFTPIFSRKPKICVMHHVHKDIFKKELPFYLAWIGYFLEALMMPLVYRNVRFVAVSPSTQDAIIKLGILPENIQVVYNGINEEFSADFKKKEKNLIVYIGRIKKYKQLDHLVKAFRIVKKRKSDAELVIAGRGDFSEIEELSRKLNLKLNLIHEITEEEKINLLQKATIFVTPSAKEGWGLTVIEANKCGTPVIAYDVPGLRDSIKNGFNGFLVKDGDIAILSIKILDVLINEGLREELNRNAILWAEQFSWDKSAHEFEKIIKNEIYIKKFVR